LIASFFIDGLMVMTMDEGQLKDTHRVASPSTATPRKSSQVASLDWVPSPPSQLCQVRHHP
ncbi:TPA: hypothetical protein ACKP5W_002571, partial [Pseudomonas aeruginosa]